MIFSERSKYLRKEKELSQVELAKALNISKACISMIEIGKNEPTAATLEKYADFFEVSTDYLLGREDDFGIIHPATVSPAPTLTQEEKQLLEDYRALEPKYKEVVRSTLKTLKGSEIKASKQEKAKGVS